MNVLLRPKLVFHTIVMVCATLGVAQAADLDSYGFRRHHHRSAYGTRAVAYIPTCGLQEPSDYKPRITNFDEPFCYAARPYGLSAHLYDYSLEARGGD